MIAILEDKKGFRRAFEFSEAKPIIYLPDPSDIRLDYYSDNMNFPKDLPLLEFKLIKQIDDDIYLYGEI